jgi:TPR repeat protein
MGMKSKRTNKTKIFPAFEVWVVCFISLTLFSLFLSCSSVTAQQPPTPDYGQLVVNAVDFLKEGELAEAQQAAQQAITFNATNYEAYAVAAKIASKQGDSDGVNKFIQKALELASDEDKDKVQQLAEELKSATPSSTQPPELSDEDRLTLNTLMLLLDQADQAATPEDRDKAFSDFLERSADFAKAHPEQTNIWIMRAVAAIDLNRSHDAWQAGQRLKALGLLHSDDPKVGKVFAELNLKGWLGNTPPEAQAVLDYKTGLAYEQGQGVSQDYTQAQNYFQKAAAEGNADAENNLGTMYQSGQGVPQDYGQALNWYNQAAAKGNADAEDNLGNMYISGQGVTQDFAQALNWYQKSAAQGDADAEYNLGVMYYSGFGVGQDYEQAANWYRKSAAQGNANGEYALGSMYEVGFGVNKDVAEAKSWYQKAADQGLAHAKEGLARLNGMNQ